MAALTVPHCCFGRYCAFELISNWSGFSIKCLSFAEMVLSRHPRTANRRENIFNVRSWGTDNRKNGNFFFISPIKRIDGDFFAETGKRFAHNWQLYSKCQLLICRACSSSAALSSFLSRRWSDPFAAALIAS